MKKSAFTLVEIVVAVAILATVMVLVVSFIINIFHFSHGMSLQRQINREARNITEMIAREGRLARGATGPPLIEAIQIGHLIPDGSKSKFEENSSFNTAVNFREVPQLGRAFGLFPDPNGSLNIVNQPYDVAGSSSINPADIVIVLDQSGSMLEPSDAGSGLQSCFDTSDNNYLVAQKQGIVFHTIFASGYSTFNLGAVCTDQKFVGADKINYGGDGNGDYWDEYQKTKYYKSREVILDFLSQLKAAEDLPDSLHPDDFRVLVITFARNDEIFTDFVPSPYFVRLYNDPEYLALTAALSPDPAVTNSKNGVLGATNIEQGLRNGFDHLKTLAPTYPAPVVPNKVEIFLTDGKANFPAPTGQLVKDHPAYNPDCNKLLTVPYYDPPSDYLKNIGVTTDLLPYIQTSLCYTFSRDIAWQRAMLNGTTNGIQTYAIGYGPQGSWNLDEPLLNSIASFGSDGKRSAFIGTDLKAVFDSIATELKNVTYTAKTTLGVSTSSATLFQVTALNFITNNDKTWLQMDLGLETKDYNSSLPWQRAKINLHTFFTTRSYP